MRSLGITDYETRWKLIRHVSIEEKIGKDTLGAEQVKTKKLIQASGGLYYVAKDFESFYRSFKNPFELPARLPARSK